MEKLIALPQVFKDDIIEFCNEYLDLMYCTGLCCFALDLMVHAQTRILGVDTAYLIAEFERIAEAQGIKIKPKDGYWISDENFEIISKPLSCVPINHQEARAAYYNYWYFVALDGRSLRNEHYMPKELLPEIEKYSDIRRNIVKQFVEELIDA